MNPMTLKETILLKKTKAKTIAHHKNNNYYCEPILLTNPDRQYRPTIPTDNIPTDNTTMRKLLNSVIPKE